MTDQVVTSVLDRLVGSIPSDRFAIGATNELDLIIQNVRRDLQDLLNTRKAPLTKTVANEPLLNSSLLNYGMPDFASFNPESSSDKKRLKKILEQLIATYEPRLQKVTVKLLENSDRADFRFRFHIDAVLCVEELVIPVQFNSVMEASPPYFDVKDAVYE